MSNQNHIKPRTKSQIKSELKEKSDELARVGNLKFDDSEIIAKGHVQTLRNEVSDLQDELDKLEAKDDGRWTVSEGSVNFNEMCWPRFNDHNGMIGNNLRFHPELMTKSEQLQAASIINAYLMLINMTNDKRNFICNRLKLVESVEKQAAEVIEDHSTNPPLSVEIVVDETTKPAMNKHLADMIIKSHADEQVVP